MEEYTPTISVIVPCRNEQQFLRECLDSVIASDYPSDRLEVVVVDGMSEDRSPEIIQEYCRQYPFIHAVQNPLRIKAAANNLGIKATNGELILIMDAHAFCEKRYIRECVDALFRYHAD